MQRTFVRFIGSLGILVLFGSGCKLLQLSIIPTGRALSSSPSPAPPGGTTPGEVLAKAFAVALSQSTGAAGAPVRMTLTPAAGQWPAGGVVVPSASNLAGSWDNSSLPASGSKALIFTFTPSSAPGSSGMLSATAPGMTNASGPQPYSVGAISFNTVANRYDNLPSASAVAVGTPITITLAPNGAWPNATLTPTLQSGSGTFVPATINVVAGNSSPATIQYTPSATGEHNIKFGNNAGLHNPYQVPLNVFAASGGTARTLTAALGRSYADLHVFQRDAFSSDAAGFSLGSRGWGEVWIELFAIGGASGALWARPYDALSAGATTSAGTGTALGSAPAQVYGAVSAAGTVRLLLPAQDAICYWDIATDQAMTNPVRISQRISVADKIGAMTRSQKAGWGRGYANIGPNPTGVSYDKAIIALMANTGNVPSSDAGYGPLLPPLRSRQDGADGDPVGSRWYNEGTSAAAMEAGRLFSSLRGVNLGVIADCGTGGNINDFIDHDGSSLFTAFAALTDNKLRYLTINMTDWSRNDPAYPTETAAEDLARYTNFVAKVTEAIPSLAVIGGNTGDTGIFGNDGSRILGFTRNQLMWRQLSAENPMVASLEDYHWAGFNGGHSTQASRVQYARQDVRYLLSRDIALAGGFQTSDIGPTLATTGTIQSGTNTIKIAYSLNGAASLHSYQIRENPDAISSAISEDTASASDLASLFAVYPQGGYSGAAGALGKPIPITGVRFDGGFIYITLSSNANASMTVHYASDFNVSGGTGLAASNPGGAGLVTILGDNLDPLRIGLGQSMLAQLDIAVSVTP